MKFLNALFMNAAMLYGCGRFTMGVINMSTEFALLARVNRFFKQMASQHRRT